MTYENSRYFHRADRLPITVIRYPSSVGVGAGCALDQISQTFKSREPITDYPPSTRIVDAIESRRCAACWIFTFLL